MCFNVILELFVTQINTVDFKEISSFNFFEVILNAEQLYVTPGEPQEASLATSDFGRIWTADTLLTGKGPNHNTKNIKILFSGQITVFKSSTKKWVHFWLQQIP